MKWSVLLSVCCLLSGCVSVGSGRRASDSARHREPEILGSRHHVAPGETLYSIAQANGVTADELARANRILNPKALRAGDVLFIPAAGRGGSGSGTRAAATRAEVKASSSAPAATKKPSVGELALRAARAGPGKGDERKADAKKPASAKREKVPSTPPPPLKAPARRDPLPMAERRKGPRGQLDWPVRGVLYARFGKKGREAHDGVDLSAPLGTPVRAAAPGKVLFAGEQKAYGKIAIVQHPGQLVTLYAHCNELLVETGESIREGQVVATVGESGRTSGPHLHFEVRRNGRPVDPLPFLEPKSSRGGAAARRKVR